MKKCKLILLIFLGLINVQQANAQSEPMFTQYSFNEIFINPAYAGSHDALSFSSVYRRQWIRINGSPTTKTFTAHSQLLKSRVGLGLTAYQDNIGVTTQTGVFGNYAYRLKLNKGTLAMGLLGGYIAYQENLSDVETNDIDDNEFLNNTPSAFAPNFGFGTYYYTKVFYLGLSAPRLIFNKLYINQNNEVERVTSSFVKEEVHLFLASGFIFDVNPLLKIRPSGMLKVVMNAPIEYDLNLAALVLTSVWIGGGYRSGDAWNLMTAMQINDQLRVAYSLDFTFTNLRHVAGSTHELSLNYVLRYNKGKVTSPRYF